VEKSQYKLCIEVLERLNKIGLLNELILIGSWCMPFYEEYFKDVDYAFGIRTRDIDFLVPIPAKIKISVDIPKLLKDLGFVVSFKGEAGFIKLEHPDLIIEFLVPERGKGIEKPVSLRGLGVNATALRFLDLLCLNTIRVNVKDFKINLPHPINFALHKLIISHRRRKAAKTIMDRNGAIEILEALMKKGEKNNIKDVFRSFHKKWQDKIVKALKASEEKEILKMLINNESA